MKEELLHWLLYDVTAGTSLLNGVRLRGRTRKFAVEHGINMLIENTTDIPNSVRFAVLSENDAQIIATYIQSIIADSSIALAGKNVANPVLSKLTVNNLDKYTL